MKKIILILLSITNFIQLNAQDQVNSRAEWFVNDRFGMFIHWGIYSGAEGIWKGEHLRHNNDYAEWIQYRNSISKEEYLSILENFDWDKIDVEEWVLLAKEAGMKYITITAKHHDGFCLWNSKVSDYDMGNHTRRDIIAELAEACKKHNIRLGFYYSHWIDWEHEYAWDHSKEITDINHKDFNIYWQEKVIPQVKELLTNYGEISLMWFDMWIHHSKTCVTKEQLLQLKKMIRELQPNCLVNSRLGLSMEEDSDVDFQTLGDNQLGNEKKDFPWQSPGTVAHSWGYNSYDTDFKSTSFLLQALISNVSLNGNYMLNVGPRANGDIQYEVKQRLMEIGNWLKVNGESVYGAEAFDLRKDQHDWGRITFNAKSNKLYLHVFNWPIDNRITLTGINSKPDKIYMLADSEQLNYDHQGVITNINLPNKQTDPFVSVVVLEYADEIKVTKGLIAKNNQDGYQLLPENTILKHEYNIIKKQKYGTIPQHICINQNFTLKWRIYIEEPCKKQLDISYSLQQKESNSQILVKASDQTLKSNLKFTGKTVGEPNSDWHIEKYVSHRLGEFTFTKAGFYDIEIDFNIPNNEEVKFQWAWLK